MVENIKAFFGRIFDAAKSAAKSVLRTISGIFDKIGNHFKNPTIKQFFNKAARYLENIGNNKSQSTQATRYAQPERWSYTRPNTSTIDIKSDMNSALNKATLADLNQIKSVFGEMNKCIEEEQAKRKAQNHRPQLQPVSSSY